MPIRIRTDPHRCMQGLTGPLGGSCFCKQCRACRIRIRRTLEGEPRLALDWQQLKHKGPIIVKAKWLSGDSLLWLLRKSITEVYLPQARYTGLLKSFDVPFGNFKTKKPDTILKRAKRRTCPVTKIEPIEDMQCTSVASSSESYAPKDRYVKVLTNFRLLDKHEDAVTTKFIIIVDEVYKNLNKENEENGWGRNIPAYIQVAHRALQVKKQEFLDKQLPLEATGMCDVKAFEADLSEVKDAATELLRRAARIAFLSTSRSVPSHRRKAKAKARGKGNNVDGGAW